MKQVVASLILLLASLSAFGQGCSDAGFCTLPSFKPDESSDSKFNMELRGSLEGSEPGALIISPQLWFNYKVSDAVKLSLKTPFWLVSDAALGNVSGFSDPIISSSFRIYKKEELAIFITGGFRIGIGNATAKGLNNNDLPMDYQPTLGTTDLIFGGSAEVGLYSFSLALQLPVWQYNRNQHVVLNNLDNPLIDPISLEYVRRADIMARIDRVWRFNDWGLKIGLLPIFHVANDELLSTENTGYVTIEGSQGFTINIPFGAWYNLDSWTFGLDGGFPVVTRDARPDGLTRRFVLQPRVAFNF